MSYYTKLLKAVNEDDLTVMLEDKYKLQYHDVDEEGGTRFIFDDEDGYEYDVYFDQTTDMTVWANKVSFMDVESKEWVDLYLYKCVPFELSSDM
jgi:hypothetical protein